MMDWQAFNDYQEQQRKLQADREHELAIQRQLAAEKASMIQEARELKRRANEHQQSVQREIEVATIREKREQALERRQALEAERVEALRLANQQREAALNEARNRLREIQQSVKNGSPIEEAFYEAWCLLYPDIPLERQHRISKYRVDFAHVEAKIVIELDGQAFHSHKRDRNRDYMRQHTIEDQGWYVLRFTGSQVWNDVEFCVKLAYSRIMARQGQVRCD